MDLHGPVRPVQATTAGNAVVVISLDSWIGATVAPTEHTITVVRPKAGAKSEPVSARLIGSLVHPERKAYMAGVRYSPNGARLFTAGYPSNVLQLWDVATGKEVRRIEAPGYLGSEEPVGLTADWSAVYLPRFTKQTVRSDKDGRVGWRINFEGNVLVYDVASGVARPPLKAPPGRAILGAFASPDGRKLVTTEVQSYQAGDRVEFATVLWDTRTETAKPLGTGMAAAAFTPDAQRFALCLTSSDPRSGVLKLFDANGDELAELAASKGELFSRPTISPDGQRLAAVQAKRFNNQSAVVHVWDLSTRKELAAFPSGGEFSFAMIDFSPDSQRLAATDFNSGVRVWDVATGRPVLEKSLGGQMRVRSLAFAPDGRRLAVAGQPKWDEKENRDPDPLDLPQPRVFLFDLTAPAAEPEVVICPHGYAGGLAISPDGKTLAAGGAGAVHLLDLTRKK